MKPLGIDWYVIECSTKITRKISEMFATWPRSTSSLMAARMPMIPPAITNCTPRVHDLVGWYVGSPSTAFRSWTIRSLVFTATARMPYSSLSHHQSTSLVGPVGELLGPGEEVALLDRVALAPRSRRSRPRGTRRATSGRPAVAVATRAPRILRRSCRPPCGPARSACGRAAAAAGRACSTRCRAAARGRRAARLLGAWSLSRRTITSPIGLLSMKCVGRACTARRIVSPLWSRVEEGDVRVAAVVGHERAQEAGRAVRAQLEDRGAHAARVVRDERATWDRRSGSAASRPRRNGTTDTDAPRSVFACMKRSNSSMRRTGSASPLAFFLVAVGVDQRTRPRRRTARRSPRWRR